MKVVVAAVQELVALYQQYVGKCLPANADAQAKAALRRIYTAVAAIAGIKDQAGKAKCSLTLAGYPQPPSPPPTCSPTLPSYPSPAYPSPYPAPSPPTNVGEPPDCVNLARYLDLL